MASEKADTAHKGFQSSPVQQDLSERQQHKFEHNPARNRAEDVRLDQSNAPFPVENAGHGIHVAGNPPHHDEAMGAGQVGQFSTNSTTSVNRTADSVPRREGHCDMHISGRDEKRNQALIGEPFVTGSSADGGADMHRQTGSPELTSGSGKDGEGAKPITLGGDYERNYTKPVGEQDFDEVHGHKTDIPWNSGQGSGFDKDWQYQ